MSELLLQQIATIDKAIKNAIDPGMIDRPLLDVRHQVLLTDIGDVIALRIFSEQMIEGLVFGRANFLGNRIIPLVTVGIYGIDVENDSAKWKMPMPNDLSDSKTGVGD
jgi:hypothetical protein